MQKKQVTRRTMQLNRETISVLTGKQLGAVQGGWGPSIAYKTACSTLDGGCVSGDTYGTGCSVTCLSRVSANC
jgi:hypothetical protein